MYFNRFLFSMSFLQGMKCCNRKDTEIQKRAHTPWLTGFLLSVTWWAPEPGRAPATTSHRKWEVSTLCCVGLPPFKCSSLDLLWYALGLKWGWDLYNILHSSSNLCSSPMTHSAPPSPLQRLNFILFSFFLYPFLLLPAEWNLMNFCSLEAGEELCPATAQLSGILFQQLGTKALTDGIFHCFSHELSSVEGDGEKLLSWKVKQWLAGRSCLCG